MWSDEHRDWLLPRDSADVRWRADTSDTAPMSVLRYLERTREPLVVDDATRDDRFARDPYFADVDCCSLLAIPILSRGILRAVLLLENRLIRGAFTAERLDAVKLIAGQLAVSLDNAQLYSELTASRARIVAASDQTRRQIERDLHDGAQQRLVSLILELGMAQAEVSTEDHELRMQLGHFTEQARDALKELRDLSRGIHPAILTEGGLGQALRAMTRRSPIPVRSTCASGTAARSGRVQRLLHRRRGFDQRRQALWGVGDYGERRSGAGRRRVAAGGRRRWCGRRRIFRRHRPFGAEGPSGRPRRPH